MNVIVQIQDLKVCIIITFITIILYNFLIIYFTVLGNFCEMNINDCINSPCENNGTCIDGVKDYSCKCYTGYTGNYYLILN